MIDVHRIAHEVQERFNGFLEDISAEYDDILTGPVWWFLRNNRHGCLDGARPLTEYVEEYARPYPHAEAIAACLFDIENRNPTLNQSYDWEVLKDLALSLYWAEEGV